MDTKNKACQPYGVLVYLKKGSEKMGKNYFSEEIIQELSGNKYVKKITKKQIIFTEEFRKILVEKHEQGMRPTQILMEAGIPHRLLGQDRVDNMIRRFTSQSKRIEGFKRIKGSGRPKSEKPEFKNIEEELQYYKDQAEYYKQENDFIKKIQALEEKEAARLSRVKNSKS